MKKPTLKERLHVMKAIRKAIRKGGPAFVIANSGGTTDVLVIGKTGELIRTLNQSARHDPRLAHILQGARLTSGSSFLDMLKDLMPPTPDFHSDLLDCENCESKDECDIKEEVKNFKDKKKENGTGRSKD